MGSSSMGYKRGHQQQQSNRLPLFALPWGLPMDIYKRIERMAEVKFILLIGNFLGYSMTGYVLIFASINGWKTDILWFLSALFLAVRIYFYVRKQIQEIKNRNLSLMKKEHEVEKELEE